MYTCTFLISQGTGAYFETVSRLALLADVKRNVFSTLRSCRKELLSAVVIVRDVQGGGEYWIDTYRGRIAAHWDTPLS
jgi:hypothetical protein